MVQLVGKEVGQVGFGLMGMTWRSHPVEHDIAFDAMNAALENEVNFWNGGEIYGTPEHNSLHLLHAYFSKYPEKKDKIVISIKGAVDTAKHKPDGTPEGVRRSVDNCLKVLDGKKKLDLFECARVDSATPIEDTIETLAEYIKAEKLGGISLSECSADTIRRAAKIHKIECVELELSLFSTDLLDSHREVSETCKEFDIPIIAYSPLGRGLLDWNSYIANLTRTGQIRSPADFPEGDLRVYQPRFQGDSFKTNLELADEVAKIAQRKGCTPGQVAISWVVQLSGQNGLPTFMPIPGATRRERVQENVKLVSLTGTEVKEIDDILKRMPVIGGRYPAGLDKLEFGSTPPRK